METILTQKLFNHCKKVNEFSNQDKILNRLHFKQSIRDHMDFNNMELETTKVNLCLYDILHNSKNHFILVLIYLITRWFFLNSKWRTTASMATWNWDYRFWWIFEKYFTSWCITTIFKRTLLCLITNTSAILPNIFHDC